MRLALTSLPVLAFALMLGACQPADPAEGPATEPAAVPAEPPLMPADAPPQEEPVDATLPAGAPVPATDCRSEIGEAASARLVQRCIAVSPATRPPCNALNPCALIQSEIDRSCAMITDGDTPGACAG